MPCRWSINFHHFALQTTELCAKQDAYYREVISELENRLNETVAGRDHVLTLRYIHVQCKKRFVFKPTCTMYFVLLSSTCKSIIYWTVFKSNTCTPLAFTQTGLYLHVQSRVASLRMWRIAPRVFCNRVNFSLDKFYFS